MTQPTDPLYEHFGDMIPKQLQPTDAQVEEELYKDDFVNRLRPLGEKQFGNELYGKYLRLFHDIQELHRVESNKLYLAAKEQARQELLDELKAATAYLEPYVSSQIIADFIANRTAPTEEDKKTKENL